MSKQKGFWQTWLTGGKIVIAGMVGGIIVGLAYAILMGMALLAGGGAGALMVAGAISAVLYVVFGIFLLGYFANKFWGMR